MITVPYTNPILKMVRNLNQRIIGIRLLTTGYERRLATATIIGAVSVILDALAIIIFNLTLVHLLNPQKLTLGLESASHYFSMNMSLITIKPPLISLFLICIYILKFVVTVLYTWYTARICSEIESNLHSRLLYGQLTSRSYADYLCSEPSRFTARVLTSPHTFSQVMLFPLLQACMHSVAASAISIAMFIIAPVPSFAVLMLFTILIFTYFSTVSGKLRQAGTAKQESTENLHKVVVETIEALREARILQAENRFIQRAVAASTKRAHSQATYNTFWNLPKLGIELVLVLVLALILGISTLSTMTESAAIATIATFFLASARLMPALQSLMASWTAIQYAKAEVDNLIGELKVIETTSVVGTEKLIKKDIYTIDSTIHEIECTGVEYSLPNGKQLLTGGQLYAGRGEIIAIIGSSGSGKTTLLNILMGFLPPRTGSVKANKQSITTNPQWWLQRIAFVPQQLFLVDDTITANIALGIEYDKIDRVRLENAIELAGLKQHFRTADEMNSRIGERGERLSGGQRQRIAIARALYFQRQVLFLDEPISSLDPESAKQIMATLKNLKKDHIIIVVLHQHQWLHLFDRIYHLEYGQIAKAS